MSGIRQAGPHDAWVIAEIEVETWRATYAGMLTDQLLVGMSRSRHRSAWLGQLLRPDSRVLVWEDHRQRVVGFGHWGRQREQSLAYAGEVYTLYVLPDAQGAGIGRRLLLAMFANMLDQGMPSALIWVLAANPSRFFYERLGGKLVLSRQTPVGGRLVDTLGYGWADVGALLDRHASGRRRNR